MLICLYTILENVVNYQFYILVNNILLLKTRVIDRYFKKFVFLYLLWLYDSTQQTGSVGVST